MKNKTFVGPQTAPHLSNTYTFECNRWLADDEDDKVLVRELPATGAKLRKPLRSLTYTVDVYTGDKRGAGTDANVYCILHGKLGDTGERQLTKSTQHTNKFERKQLDTFVLDAVDLGELQSLTIGHDGSGPGAGWHLDKVAVKVGRLWVLSSNAYLVRWSSCHLSVRSLVGQ
jgi:hypothetical protein